MAVNPGVKRYAEAELSVQSVTGGTRTVTVTAQGGAYPGANVAHGATTMTLDVAEGTSGTAPPTAVWGVAVVRDNSDVGANGNYTVTGNVLAYTAIGNGGSLPSTVVVNTPEFGTFRIVLTCGSSAALAQNGTGTDQGATSTQHHFDTDSNSLRGSLAPTVTGTLVDGYNWRETRLQSRSYSTAGNLRYGQTTTITTDICSGTMINPKPIKVGLRTASADGTMQDGIYRPTPTTAGASTTVTIQVDTDFLAAATNYYLHLGVGSTFGESIPTNERPDFLTSGTITGTTAAQRHWLQFSNGAQALAGFTGSGNNRIVSDATDKQIGSQVLLKSASNGSTNGVLAYPESGRTNLNKLFLNRQTASVDGPFGHIYYRAWAYDAYGNALPSGVAFNLATLDSAGASENSQNINTGTAGILEWDYQIADAHLGFNRFKRTSPDDPDALGTHHIAIPLASVYKPAGSKTNTYSDPKSPTTTRDFAAATFPARAKDVRLTGNVFGSKEPTDTELDQWGLSSEIIYAGMWSGNTSDTAIDANGVPTGPVTRAKVTAAGSYAFKLSSRIDEAAFAIEDDTAHAPTDVAGRVFDYTGGIEIEGRSATFQRTAGSPIDTGTDLDQKQNGESPQGYSIHSPDNQTFHLVAATSDAATLAVYLGYSWNSTQRSTFGLTAGASEIPGFTSDSGLYGYRLQVVEYTVIRDDLSATLSASPTNPPPGGTVIFKANAYQVLPDKSLIPNNFDDRPVIYILRVNALGVATEIYDTLTMEPIGAEPAHGMEKAWVTPSVATGETFRAFGFSKIQGSRANFDGINVSTLGGSASQASSITPFVGDFTVEGRHWLQGDSFTATVLALYNNGTDLAASTLADDIVTYTITGVNQGSKTFTVTGNHEDDTPVGRVIEVTGSTGNDGEYKVESATDNGGDTDIVVVEAIPSATADGSIDNDLLQPTALVITADNRSLQLDGTFAVSAIVSHGLPAGSYTWPSTVTEGWPKVPLFWFFSATILDAFGNRVPLAGSSRFDIVGKKNRHDKNAFDPTGLFK